MQANLFGVKSQAYPPDDGDETTAPVLIRFQSGLSNRYAIFEMKKKQRIINKLAESFRIDEILDAQQTGSRINRRQHRGKGRLQ
jgi:hypothetical protein